MYAKVRLLKYIPSATDNRAVLSKSILSYSVTSNTTRSFANTREVRKHQLRLIHSATPHILSQRISITSPASSAAFTLFATLSSTPETPVKTTSSSSSSNASAALRL